MIAVEHEALERRAVAHRDDVRLLDEAADLVDAEAHELLLGPGARRRLCGEVARVGRVGAVVLRPGDRPHGAQAAPLRCFEVTPLLVLERRSKLVSRELCPVHVSGFAAVSCCHVRSPAPYRALVSGCFVSHARSHTRAAVVDSLASYRPSCRIPRVFSLQWL